jgi:type II secretory pathway pseudopilin PulG
MTKNQHGFSIIESFGLIVVAIVLGVVGMYVFKKQQTKSNVDHFQNLTTITEKYYLQHMEALDAKGSAEELKKECFMSEQTDYDRGNLWCGLRNLDRNVITSSDQTVTESHMKNFEGILKSQDFKTSFTTSANSICSGFCVSGQRQTSSEPKYCDVSAKYLPKAEYKDAKTTIKYSLSCQDSSSTIPAGFSDKTNE